MPRTFQIPAVRKRQHLPEERRIPSGKDRLCTQPEQEEGLDRFHLYRYQSIRGRNPSNLWETLGNYADIGIIPHMPIL